MDGPALDLIVRWESALPVRQALAKLKPGPFVDRELTDYVIAVIGAPRSVTGGEVARDGILVAKGKPALRSSDVQFIPRERTADIFFVFPRSAPLAVDVKDVEFSARIGPLNVRAKFHLKDLVYQGKLEL